MTVGLARVHQDLLLSRMSPGSTGYAAGALAEAGVVLLSVKVPVAVRQLRSRTGGIGSFDQTGRR
jgi:hypothetical protein